MLCAWQSGFVCEELWERFIVGLKSRALFPLCARWREVAAHETDVRSAMLDDMGCDAKRTGADVIMLQERDTKYMRVL